MPIPTSISVLASSVYHRTNDSSSLGLLVSHVWQSWITTSNRLSKSKLLVLFALLVSPILLVFELGWHLRSPTKSPYLKIFFKLDGAHLPF